MTAEIAAAGEQYIARRDRNEHPDGSFDKAKRFYLSASECRSCCAVREPSRLHPYSQMVHARTFDHVMNLHGFDTAKSKQVRAWLRSNDPQVEVLRAQRVAARDGRIADIVAKARRGIARLASEDQGMGKRIAAFLAGLKNASVIRALLNTSDYNDILDNVADMMSDAGQPALAVWLVLIRHPERLPELLAA